MGVLVATSCPSPPPLPSHSSHPPCGRVGSGGGGVVGVPSTSEVAATMQETPLPHQQKAVCAVVPDQGDEVHHYMVT